jgi:hypothetical protein
VTRRRTATYGRPVRSAMTGSTGEVVVMTG